jgi:hypothetical protein
MPRKNWSRNGRSIRKEWKSTFQWGNIFTISKLYVEVEGTKAARTKRDSVGAANDMKQKSTSGIPVLQHWSV